MPTHVPELKGIATVTNSSCQTERPLFIYKWSEVHRTRSKCVQLNSRKRRLNAGEKDCGYSDDVALSTVAGGFRRK